MDSTDRIIARFQHSYTDFNLDVDLNFPAQGVTALFGHSGSGKTTLLRCIAGLERPRQVNVRGTHPRGAASRAGYLSVAGEVWQDDTTALFLPTHQRPLGYVFQEASLFPHLNVKQNLQYGQKRALAPVTNNLLDQAVTLLGIAPLLARMPAHLSGGEQQRVGIARALASNPRILLMDEPLAALDLQRKAEILPYLERLHKELAVPILYVSHALDEVARLADRMIVLVEGRVQADDTTTAVFARADLYLAQDEDAGVVLDATLDQHDLHYALSRLNFTGGVIWVRHIAEGVGSKVRMRILARDVSLTRVQQRDTSILNILPVRIVAINQDRHPSQVLVQLDASGTTLFARITRRSLDAMGLKPGESMWAQLKSVALLR